MERIKAGLDRYRGDVVMTEDRAATKWCPFSRVALVQGMAANRTATMGTGGYADVQEETRCLGSGCMAWRWDQVVPSSPSLSEGHCGLAGQ